MSKVRESFERLADNARLAVWWDEYCDGEGSPFVAQYEIRGQDSGTWHVAISSDSPLCTVSEGLAENPDLTLILSDVDWLAIVTAQSSVWAVMRSGRVTVAGDQTLIGDLNLLGFLGPPVTRSEFSASLDERWLFREAGDINWVHGEALWVVPRVLTAGTLDYDKWRYFTDRGDLQAEISRKLPWRALSAPAATPYTKTLPAVLRPLYWRYVFLRYVPLTPLLWLGVVASVVVIAIAALIAALITRSWAAFTSLLVAAVVLLTIARYVCDPLDPFDGTYRRAQEVLGRLAQDDREFFALATESALMQIGRSRGLK